MPNHEPSRLSRRTVLTALGAAPLVAGGMLAIANAANATDAAPQNGSVPPDLRPGGTLDKFVAQLAAEDKFSGSVLLVHQNRPVLMRAYGMANKDLRLPNQPNTTFATASITKLFTQVAIDQLARQGKLAYDGKLGDYLDGFPAEIADTVTVDHLLTHTSGMGDFHQEEGFLDEARTWDSAAEVMNGIMAYIRKEELSFPPGTGNQYSNSGYVTLGAIVQKVSDQLYYEYVREHVFRPAGMTSSDFYTTPHWRADRRIARPYTILPSGERVDAIDKHLFIGTPAGGAFANTADLVRFTKTHLAGRPINAHGGNPGGGVCADLDSYPDSDWITAILSNYEDATQPIDDLARQIITGHEES
jgi:CubicO group peptidase (beta-lactamase class C family)